MCKFARKLFVAAVVALFSTVSNAALVNWTANMDGSQEVVPNASTAIGLGVGTLDTVSGLLTWDISWSDTFPEVAMHFHGPAAPGSSGGVQIDIGAESGLSSPSIGSSIISESQISDLLDGLWYINLHTTVLGAGEIRGQVISAVPVPAAVWLLGSGLLGFVGISRRKERNTI